MHPSKFPADPLSEPLPQGTGGAQGASQGAAEQARTDGGQDFRARQGAPRAPVLSADCRARARGPRGSQGARGTPRGLLSSCQLSSRSSPRPKGNLRSLDSPHQSFIMADGKPGSTRRFFKSMETKPKDELGVMKTDRRRVSIQQLPETYFMRTSTVLKTFCTRRNSALPSYNSLKCSHTVPHTGHTLRHSWPTRC